MRKMAVTMNHYITIVHNINTLGNNSYMLLKVATYTLDVFC